MRFYETGDPRLKITASINDLAGEALPVFFRDYYHDDKPVVIVHRNDVDSVVTGRNAVTVPPGAFHPYTTREIIKGTLKAGFGDFGLYTNMARRAWISATHPWSQVYDFKREDEFRADVLRDLESHGSNVHARDKMHVVMIEDYQKHKIFDSTLNVHHSIQEPGKMPGDEHDWQCLIMFHECGHVFDDMSPNKSQLVRAGCEGAADAYARQMYGRANDEFGMHLEESVPDIWQLIRQASLLKGRWFPRCHFPGEDAAAELFRGPDGEAALKGHDYLREFLPEEDPIRFASDAISLTRTFASAFASDEMRWSRYWLEQAREGWQGLVDLGALRMNPRRNGAGYDAKVA
jgi:hypothetical protein